jgi:hypothetical protein
MIAAPQVSAGAAVDPTDARKTTKLVEDPILIAAESGR